MNIMNLKKCRQIVGIIIGKISLDKCSFQELLRIKHYILQLNKKVYQVGKYKPELSSGRA